MLQKMRQYSKSWIASVFLGGLALSFVTWGIGDVFRGSSSTALATVGRTAIEKDEFQRDYNNFIRNQGARRGKDITPEEARRENLGNILLQQDIARTALDNLVREFRLTASDDMVSAQIRAIPDFAGLTGAFDRATFQQKIERIGYSEKGFIEAIRRDTTRDQLMHAVEAGFEIPPGYARALFAYYTEVRAAEYVTVGVKAMPPVAPPADAVLAAYVKKNQDRFSTPEYRDVTYAEIGPDDVSKTIAVTDAQIQTFYDTHKDKFVIAEKRELEQIVFPSQAEAAAARAKIDAGQGFAQIAAARGMKPADLELGSLVAADLDPERSKAVFALPAGGVTLPVKGAFGWALLRVVKIVPGNLTTPEQARDDIKKALLQELAAAKLVDVVNAYGDAVNDGASLTEAAEKVGMRSGRVAAIDASGLAPDGSKAAAPDDKDFRAQTFKADVGEEGDPFESKSGHYYVVSVNGVVPPKLKPLAAVRAEALAAWTDVQRAILLKKKAGELAAQANKDKTLANVAKAIGATIHSSPALMHETSDATFSPELVAALFAAAPGACVYGPQGKGGEYVVARVSGIFHPLPPTGDPNFVNGARLFSRSVNADISESLSNAARAKQGVKINSKMFDNVIGGEGS